MSNFLGRSFLYFSLSSLCACANLNSVLVTPPVESPVVSSGKGDFGFAFGSVPTHEYEFTGDASSRPPDLSDPEMSPSTLTRGIFINVGYSLLDRLNVGIDFHPLYLSLIEPKVKCQVFGEFHRGFQMALLGRLGLTGAEKKGDQSGTFGAGGYDWKGRTSGRSYSGGVSLGYYVNPNTLIYAGANYGSMKVKADIDHKESSDGLSPAAHYSVDDSGTMLTVGGGVSFGAEGPVSLGYNYSEVDYEKTPTLFGHELLVSFEF